MRIAEVYAFARALAGQMVPTTGARIVRIRTQEKPKESKVGKLAVPAKPLKTFGNSEGQVLSALVSFGFLGRDAGIRTPGVLILHPGLGLTSIGPQGIEGRGYDQEENAPLNVVISEMARLAVHLSAQEGAREPFRASSFFRSCLLRFR